MVPDSCIVAVCGAGSVDFSFSSLGIFLNSLSRICRHFFMRLFECCIISMCFWSVSLVGLGVQHAAAAWCGFGSGRQLLLAPATVSSSVSISLKAWSLLKCPPTFFEYHWVDFSVIFYLRFWSWATTLPWWSNERLMGFLFSLRSVSFLLTVCSPSVSFASHFKFSWQLSTKFSWCLSLSRCWRHYILMVLFFCFFLSGEYGAHIPYFCWTRAFYFYLSMF